jgi:two-component system, response regulator / RNA-binding antiterminator
MSAFHLPEAAMRIALIDENKARAAIIEQGLLSLPDVSVHVLAERTGMARAIVDIDPDVVLMDLGNPSRDMLEEYFTVSRAIARPVAMFVDQSDEESIGAAIDAGVSAYIVDGMTPQRLRPIVDLAIRRFNAFSRLQDELKEAKDALSDRATIDAAKRVLMDGRGLSEPAAYKLLRDHAMQSNKRIVDVADAIMTADRLLKGA